MEFINEIFIERPLHEVFLFMGNPGNIPIWNYAVTDIEKINGGPIAEGTRYKQHRNFMGRTLEDIFVITAYKVDEVLTMQSIEAEYPFIINYTFAPLANGTIIINTFELHGTPFTNILGSIFKNSVKSAVAKNLTKLKEYLEKLPIPLMA